MSPETAISEPWRRSFTERRIVLVAVDEAHCILEWFVDWNENQTLIIIYITGEKFRTAFKQLGGLRALTTAPFMALTASAPPDAERQVKQLLEFQNCVVVSLPLDRPNIFMSLKKKTSFQGSYFMVLSYSLFTLFVTNAA